MKVAFAQSARKHRVGRARVLAVIEDPAVKVVIPGSGHLDDRLVFLGEDRTGRLLEVVAVEIEGGLLVIHAMDMRPKWKAIYEEGLI